MRASGEWDPPAEPAGPVSTDVLVPACDRPAELALTLANLAAQPGPSFAVIVSDQSREQGAWQHPAVAAMGRVLQAQGRPVTLLRPLPRRGLAEHRQFRLDSAGADKCLFLEDDVWLEPGSLKRLNDALDELRCGFVGMAPLGLSYRGDKRPGQTAALKPGTGRWNRSGSGKTPRHGWVAAPCSGAKSLSTSGVPFLAAAASGTRCTPRAPCDGRHTIW